LTNTTPGRYSFLPWVRQGLSAAALPPDTLGADLPARVALPVELRLSTGDPVRVPVRMYGPGDVVGIDGRQVVRTEPRALAADFEPNHLAAIEFDRPDLPWLLTPAAANAQGQLRPWICLVVVRRQPGVALTADRDRPLPTLTIEPPAVTAAELPDLADSWAWAHAQVAGSGGLEDVLANHPERTVARLICPRRLAPNERYYACVVPAFAVGTLAGLGLPLTPDDLAALRPAWASGADMPTKIALPVYFHWEFGTGVGGDFASLVRRLAPQLLPAGVGIRDLDVSDAGSGLPTPAPGSPDATLGLEGALMATETAPRGWANGFGASFRAALRQRLETATPGAGDPVVAPPVYGARHANAPGVPPDGPAPDWLRELNLDPRHRAVAAFGTAVVQRYQEQLVAAAWEQFGALERANRLLRQAQLVRAAGQSIYRRHVARLSEGALLQITRAAQTRILVGSQETAQLAFVASGAPATLVSGAFRRALRPRGTLMRRAALAGPIAGGSISVMSRIVSGGLSMQLARPAGGLVTLDAVEARWLASGNSRPPGAAVGFGALANADMASVPQRPRFQLRTPEVFTGANDPPVPMIFIRGPDTPAAAALRQASTAQLPLLRQPPLMIIDPIRPQLGQLQASLLAQIEPGAAIAGRVSRLIVAAPPRESDDPLEPIMAAPELPQPMYAPLRDISQDLLLPGLEDVPPNSVTLLKTNPRFVAAYMVGLNHELARELLWRGFPTDQRGTYFQHFWDVSGGGAPQPDIAPIHMWPPASDLAENADDGGAQLVLLIRGDLLRRYPTAIVYMAAAEPRPGQAGLRPGASEVYPLFRGTLDPDLMFFGFPLTPEQARGDGTQPGWFFVIQQPPTEPRFGLDADAPPPDTPFLRPSGDAAATARGLLLRPVRIAIHAQQLLPPKRTQAP
jgi:hypothetical protein